MPDTMSGIAPASGPRLNLTCRAGLAFVTLALALSGCATHYALPETFEVPELPAPLDPPLPLRMAVHYPPGLQEAQPELPVPPYTLLHRFEIGAASVAVFRQALTAAIASVVESSDATALPVDSVDVRLDAAAPLVTVERPPHPTLWALRLRAAFPFTLREPSGAVIGHTTLPASAALDEYFEPFSSNTALKRELLRNAAAHLIAWLRSQPSWTPVAAATLPIASSPRPRGRYTAVLRMDAGLAAGDRHEQRVTDCLADHAPPLPAHPEATPATVVRDALFPWFDPGVLPMQPDAVAALLARPAVADRLANLDIGRLLLYSLRELDPDRVDRLVCTTGPAGVCIGLYRETRRYIVDATLWDVASHRLLDRQAPEAQQTKGVVGALLPIPFITSNESEVCAALRAFVSAPTTVAP